MSAGTGAGGSELSARAARFRLVVLVLAVAAVAVVATGLGPDVATVRGWTDGTGWIAPVLFVLLYAGLTVALVPGSVLTLAAGLLFGASLGSVVAIVGATTGAAIAFGIARSAGRGAVERLVSGRAARVDTWVRDRGLLTVVTLRLVPLVPFALSNYAAGITAVRARDFVLGTALGIVPGAVAYTVLGANLADPTDSAFVGAVAALAVLSVAGAVLLRRSGRGEEDGSVPLLRGATMTTPYNYSRFDDYVEHGPERDEFAAFAGVLHAGDAAPSFDVTRLDDGAPLSMSDLWRSRDVVVEFGSFT